MASLEEIRRERLRKLENLRSAGVNPYPINIKRDFDIKEALQKFDDYSTEGGEWSVAGRVMAIRGQGAITFLDLNDGTGSIQAVLKSDEISAELFDLFRNNVDLGDFLQITGSFFTTKRGEKTVLIKNWSMISKSLRPLPDKWHGLQDVEERFRRRYLDSLMSSDVKERFVMRSRMITEVRNFLNQAGYLEVETPVLQSMAGGALAQPFITHHNALDIDLFLRIAPELYLKKMLVGGFAKVYEVARNFRNEGIDATHNPEFTMLEFYASYSTATEQQKFVEELFRQVVMSVIGQSTIAYNGQTIDFAPEFAVITYENLLKKYATISNLLDLSREEASLKAAQLGVEVEPGDSTEKIIDNIYKKTCRPKIIQPTFIVDYPVAFSPFAKRREDDSRLIDRFQLVIGGMELVNAFSELNDPLDQRERYLEQDKKRREGDADVSPSDEDYLEAMEYGMPPAGGVGIGLDRVAMLLSDTRNVKEVIYFPTMKPKDSEQKPTETE